MVLESEIKEHPYVQQKKFVQILSLYRVVNENNIKNILNVLAAIYDTFETYSTTSYISLYFHHPLHTLLKKNMPL